MADERPDLRQQLIDALLDALENAPPGSVALLVDTWLLPVAIDYGNWRHRQAREHALTTARSIMLTAGAHTVDGQPESGLSMMQRLDRHVAYQDRKDV